MRAKAVKEPKTGKENAPPVCTEGAGAGAASNVVTCAIVAAATKRRAATMMRMFLGKLTAAIV